MTLRLPAASVLVVCAVLLFATATAAPTLLHRILDAQAGHVVTAAYVDAIKTRAGVSGAIVVVIAAMAGLGLPRLRSAAPTDLRASKAALAIIAVGAVARTILLAGPLHYDEAFTMTEFASRSPLFFMTRYTHSNNHVFHTLLVWMVRTVAGQRVWAVRIPAWIAGIALLYAVYLLARRLSGETAALITVALAAGATPLVEYSAQARGYTMMALAFLLLFVFEDDRVRAALIALGAWTIPTMLYAAAAWALWALATERSWRRVVSVGVSAGALTFLLYLPILVVTGSASITSNGNTLSVSYPVLVRELPRMLVEAANDWTLSFTWGLAIFLGIAAVVAMIRREAGGLPLAFAILAIVPLLIAMRKVPYARVWLFVLPLAIIAAATTIARLVPRLPAAVAIMVAVVVAANAVRLTKRDSFVEDPAMDDVAAVSDAIRTLPPHARVLVTTPLDAPFAFYVPGRIIQYRFDSDPAAVRASVMASPRRFLAASNGPTGLSMAGSLHLPLQPVPVRRLNHATLFELRSVP